MPTGVVNIMRRGIEDLDRALRIREGAQCQGADPELFFPLNEVMAAAPLRYCAPCPVREECLAEALQLGDDFGVRGGHTASERRTMRGREALRKAVY